ncbi:MAG TPA: hypothetical protein VEL12_08160 [Candidatus Nitrosopolaris sp.]|nr:hypothetical protein [Candidatus Nitrosopolaris sp.]
MFNLKRSAIALSTVVTVGLVAVVALSSSASGQAALRQATSKLSVTAQAAGGGGGAGIDNITFAPNSSLVAKLAVNVTVSYICQPVFDPTTGGEDIIMGSQVFVSLQERTGGKTVANGSGVAFGTAVCDEFLTPTPTVNTMTVLVQPDAFASNSVPFKNGSALASAQIIACPTSFNSSGFPPPCDFGSAGPTIISIK